MLYTVAKITKTLYINYYKSNFLLSLYPNNSYAVYSLPCFYSSFICFITSINEIKRLVTFLEKETTLSK